MSKEKCIDVNITDCDMFRYKNTGKKSLSDIKKKIEEVVKEIQNQEALRSKNKDED